MALRNSLGAKLGVEGLEDRTVPAATLSGTVYHDPAAIGTQFPGESVAAGVGVTLIPLGATPISTTTDAMGDYSFPGLTEGSYVLSFSPPSG